jgi:hypothetical protein
MVKAALANSAWLLGSYPSYAAFETALSDPERAQHEVLRNFILRNSSTAFGREHGLAGVRTAQQFAQRVPVRDYDEMLPWIDRIRGGEQNVLTREKVRRLVPTSGSTEARKLIPYTKSMHDDLNRAISPWIFDLYRRCPRALGGASYWSVSPVADSQSGGDSAVPIGFEDDSEYLGGWRRRLVEAAVAVPSAVKDVDAIDDWRYLTLLFLLRRSDLSLISVWHPSFFSLLMESLERDWDRLIRDVARGTCDVAAHVSVPVAALTRAGPDRRRADELSRTGPADIPRLWPKLTLLSCWGDAQASAPALELARRLRSVTVQPKGLLATEGVVSIPFSDAHPLAVRSHFLEFEDDSGRIRLAAEIQRGEQYTVILTNSGGLCRYRLNDRVEVDGMVERTPSIRFAGKAGLISDGMGEKLSEGFVVRVIARLFERDGGKPSFAMLAPDVNDHECCYTLYVDGFVPEEFEGRLDDLLCGNPQYEYCRRLRQLGRARLYRLTGDSYREYCHRLQRAGQRLGDIKPAGLSCLENWSAHFSGYYVESSPKGGRGQACNLQFSRHD